MLIVATFTTIFSIDSSRYMGDGIHGLTIPNSMNWYVSYRTSLQGIKCMKITEINALFFPTKDCLCYNYVLHDYIVSSLTLPPASVIISNAKKS